MVGVAAQDEPQVVTGALSQGMRVLVVDDNITASQVFVEMLAAWRLQVSQCASGPEALAEIVRAEASGAPYNLILLDWKMPGMNGLEVAARIRRLVDPEGGPAVVMVSAHRDPAMVREAGALGVREVLAKPVNPSVLFDAFVAAVGDTAPTRVSAKHDIDREVHWRKILGGRTVLLVEDNDINQQIAVELLQAVGVNVVVAGNGAEALARINADMDAVLMDVQMPVMDGMEATERILATPELAHLSIIAMTANAMVEDRERALAVGMKDFVPKPVEPEELYAALARHVRVGEAAAVPAEPVARPLPRPLREGRPKSLLALADSGDWQQLSLPETIEGVDMVSARRRLAGKDALVGRLLYRFVEQQADVVDRIEANLASGDNQTAVREAHSLKGLAASLGVKVVSERAAAVEAILVERGPADEVLAELRLELAMALEHIQAALEAALG